MEADMRRSIALAAALLVAAPLASAQEPKTAKGTVAAIGGSSVTIRAGMTEMKFIVDDRTLVEAPGAGTKARRATEKGKSGPHLADVIKAGQAVEVGYQDLGGSYHADSVRRISSAGGGMPTKSSGTVAAISGNALTISGSGRAGAVFTQTFLIDDRTQVVGKGIGTKASASGGKSSFLDLVGLGDTVSVSYRDEWGSLHASDVRVTGKAPR
jgi:hypothetical protein